MFKKKLYKHLDEIEMVKTIIEEGRINGVDSKTKQNALHFALDESVSMAVFECLLTNGIDLNVQNKQGNTPVHLCKDLDKLAVLLAFKPNLDLKNKQGHTPIFNCNDHERAKMLVDAGINLNVTDDSGQHFLKSLHTMDFDLMKIFIDKGLYRFIEKRGQTLDAFFEDWSTREVQAYFENKLKTSPEKYQVKV